MNDLAERLRTTYAVATLRRHDSAGRVEVHVSPDVLDEIRQWGRIADVSLPPRQPTIWGHPLLVNERLPEGSIQVHCVQTIS